MPTRHLIRRSLPVLLALFVIPVTAQTSQAPRVYKWVDEHGNVNYSDRLPNDPRASGISALNHEGVTVARLDTPRVDPATAAQRQEVLRNAQRDLALSVTFEDEAALLRSHEERLSSLRGALKIANSNTEKLEIALSEHEAHGARLVEQGQPVPAAVRRNIEQARHMLTEQQAEAGKIERRLNQALAEQRTELERYRQLAAREQ